METKYMRLYRQLKRRLEEQSGNGPYKLPSEQALQRLYGVSRQTVREALKLLAAEGMIEKRRGSGSYSTGLAAAPARRQIALLLYSAEEYADPALISDISAALRPRGFTTAVYPVGNSFAKEREALRALRGQPIRGLIARRCLSALPSPNLDLYERLADDGVQLLFLQDACPALPRSVCLGTADHAGGYELASHLIAQGHQQIGMLFPAESLSGQNRCGGCLCALRDNGLPLPDRHLLLYSARQRQALEERRDSGFLAAFLRRDAADCTAVICGDDEIAWHLLRELQAAGLHVPEDMSVVSFDNSYLCQMTSVRLTSMGPDAHEPGVSAAHMMLQMIQGVPVRSRELPLRLYARASSAPLLR